MQLFISHRTKLTYSRPITESVMEMRARPRTDDGQVLREFEVSITPFAQVTSYQDWLGNTVHQFSVLPLHDEVIIDVHSVVETRRRGEDMRQLAIPMSQLGVDYRSWDFLREHGPVNEDPALPYLVSELGLSRTRRVAEAFQIILTRSRDIISYQRGVTNSSSTVRDVLRFKVGVCQDFAHLAIALLRKIGVPTRYVSGYLHRANASELETHAWIESFVPGTGWIGLDPTHGTIVDERYVVLAVGRSFADVPPNRGVYRGDAEEHIAVSVQMDSLDDVPKLSLFSPVAVRPRRLVRTKEEESGARRCYGLAQQRFRPGAVGLVVQQQRQQQQ